MWSSPVIFAHDTRGTITVKDSLGALHVLDGWWQKVDGPAYKEAINVCIECIQGERSQDDARAAFMMALIEGDVTISPAV